MYVQRGFIWGLRISLSALFKSDSNYFNVFYGIIVFHNKDFIYIYIYIVFFFLFSSLLSRFYLEGSSFSWLVLKKLALKLHQLNYEAVGFCESGQFFELFRKAKTE